MSNSNQYKPGYKHTPLGWIPEEWEVKEFGKIITNSQYGLSNAAVSNGNQKIIGMKNIQEGKLITEECATIFLTDEEFAKYKLQPDDFLFNRTNSYDLVGKSVLIDTDPNATFASYLIRFKLDKKQVDPKYVYYFFNTEKSDKKLKKIATKAISQANINPTVLQDIFEILIPPVSEQIKIVAILSIWDEAITKTQQLIIQLQQRNKGLMQQLLTGKKRLNGFEEEWEEVQMNDLFERVQRKAEDEKNDLEVMTISGRFGFLSQNEKFNRVIAGNSLKNYTHLKRGEFSYNKGNSTAYQYGCVFRLDNYDEALVPNVYISFKVIANVDNTFYAFYFKHDLLKPSLAKIISSGARMDGLLNVSAEDFFKIKVPLPSLKEQIWIGSILSNATNEVTLYKQRLTTLQQQKKGLMQRLLTGEVRVKIDS